MAQSFISVEQRNKGRPVWVVPIPRPAAVNAEPNIIDPSLFFFYMFPESGTPYGVSFLGLMIDRAGDML